MACQKKIPLKEIQTEVIVIDDSDSKECINTKEIKKPKKIKHQKHKRKVHIDTSSNSETLVITQKVEVKKKRIQKQKIQCIINLSNICEHKKEKKKPQKEKKLCTERIVPHCLRKKCQPALEAKYYKIRCSERHKTKTNNSKQSSIERRRLNQNSSVKYSSISSSSMSKYSDTDLKYEDISSDSFTTAELDTLIKRTKDREKRLSTTSDLDLPLYQSTPKYMETISDAETVVLRCSEVDTSFHSTATLVLEPRTEVYSPTKPTISPKIMDVWPVRVSEQILDIKPVVLEKHTDKIECKQYSPAINYNDVYKQEYQYTVHVKEEPFSPTSINNYLGKLEHTYEGAYEVPIKFECTDTKSSINQIKTEISPNSLAGQAYDNSSIKPEKIWVEQNIPLKHEKY